MFYAGIGHIEHKDLYKENLENDDLILKIGGPIYKIGMGGGSASSRGQSDSNEVKTEITNLDLNAVQRGDPQMEQKMNRFIRSCIELESNPIKSIHDQGAGGNGNVLKEIVDPIGGRIYLDKFNFGQSNLSPLEIWTSEYQESNALIINPKDIQIVTNIAEREGISLNVVGKIESTERIDVFSNSNVKNNKLLLSMDLKKSVNCIPRKTFDLHTDKLNLTKFKIVINDNSFDNKKFLNILRKILKNIAVGSKRFQVRSIPPAKRKIPNKSGKNAGL